MNQTYLPSILVPLVGLVFPAFSMSLFFLYISLDNIDLLTNISLITL